MVAVDSVLRGVSPIFWRLTALVGGPFVLLAYGLVRELVVKRRLAESQKNKRISAGLPDTVDKDGLHLCPPFTLTTSNLQL